MTEMEDLEDFCAKQEASKGPKCKVCNLPKPTLQAVDNSSRSASDITSWLKTKGHTISEGTLRRHRRGACLGG